MNSIIRAWCMAAIALLWFAGCATGPKVTSTYDPAASFASYRSFGFYEPLGTDQAGYETLITQTLKAAVRAEMEARGYAYADSGADLLINFGANLAQRTDISQAPAPPVYYGYRRGFYGGWTGYETRVDQYVEGTLNIDLIDAQRKQLVWEGVAVGRVTRKSQQDRQAAIRAAVSEIFAKYPYRAGGAGG